MDKVNRVVATLGLIALVLMQPANAARLKSMADLESLPDTEDEAELWDRATGHEDRIREGGTVFHDPHVERYLESLADRMLGDYLDHLGVTLKFILVAEPHLSAWVYPYGTIALHTGLLVRMDNEAQLAAIMAHEISHFLQRHSYRELISENRQSAIGKGFGLLAAAALASQTGTVDSDVMNVTGDFWTNLVTSGYSQKNEYVADEEGLLLMSNAGLSRDEAIPAFEALGENTVYGADDPRKLWSSHPKLEDRLKNLNKEVAKEKKKKAYEPGTVPDPEVYYRGIAPAFVINARLDLAGHHYQRARDALDKYLTVAPDDPEAYFLTGESYRRENPRGPEFAKAIAAYRNALEVDSGYAPAYAELGMAYRIQAKTDQATLSFVKYLELAPDADDAGIIRGYLEELE